MVIEGIFIFILWIFFAILSVLGEKIITSIINIVLPLMAWMSGWWSIELTVIMLVLSVFVMLLQLRKGDIL